MASYTVQVYQVTKLRTRIGVLNSSAQPAQRDLPPPKLKPELGFTIEASTPDAAKALATERIQAEGRVLRSMSFTTDGGIVAYFFQEVT